MTKAHLERAAALAAEKQWDEAIEIYRHTLETHGSRLIRLDTRRHVSVRDFCHLRLASLPAEGLAVYRKRVDAVAGEWYEKSLAARDRAGLQRVVSEFFVSSWGDQALYAAGELALHDGDTQSARQAWESLTAASKTPDGRPRWLDPASTAMPSPWLVYPDTDCDLASVQARLVLVSILERDLVRAKAELERLAQQYPSATGRIAGKEGNLVQTLRELSAAAADWPGTGKRGDWPTLAGSFSRDRVLPGKVEVGRPLWQPIRMGAAIAADVLNNAGLRVAEDSDELLSYHPIVVGDLVLWNDGASIRAYRVSTGQPAFAQASEERLPGEIFRLEGGAGVRFRGATTRYAHGYGVARYTLSAHSGRLYARLGSPTTSRPLETTGAAYSSTLVCLDLAAEGKQLWQIKADSERWAFEGAPVANRGRVYVAMRYNDVRPQAHVACFDAETGVRLWRRLVSAAETPTRGQVEENTHTLLTLDHDSLYVATNLGAVAAISTSGDIRWLHTYPRSQGGEARAHFQRDLNPPVVAQGLVLVAASDRNPIFALDALTGQEVWKTPSMLDTVHVLGLCNGNLVASGDRLWFFDLRSGRVAGCFPDRPMRQGYGRGLIIGDRVYWPMRGSKIAVYGRATTNTTVADSVRAPEKVDEILLAERGVNATAGNLVLAGDRLLVAGGERLFGFSPYSGKAPENADRPLAGNAASDDQEETGNENQVRVVKVSAPAVGQGDASER